SLRLVDLFMRAKYACRALHDHAPALGNTVIVGLKQHLVVDSGADQLGPLRRAEQYCPVLDNEVDWKDRWLAIDARDKSPQRDARQQIPAFTLREDGDRLRFYGHCRDVTHRDAQATWPEVPQIANQRPTRASARAGNFTARSQTWGATNAAVAIA